MEKDKEIVRPTNFTANDILNYRFTTSDIGYNMLEVDKLFDEVIADYRFFEAEIASKNEEILNLETEIKKLREENDHLLLEMNVNPHEVNKTKELKFTRKDELDAQHDTEARIFRSK